MGLPFILITVNLSALNEPLRQIYVGQGSALNLRLAGFDTERFEAKAIVLPIPDSDGEKVSFDFERLEDGTMWCHITGMCMPTAGTTSYQIDLFDKETEGEIYWGGRGKLVVQSAETGDIPNPPTIPAKPVELLDPDTGEIWIMTFYKNDLGQPSNTWVRKET